MHSEWPTCRIETSSLITNSCSCITASGAGKPDCQYMTVLDLLAERGHREKWRNTSYCSPESSTSSAVHRTFHAVP